MGYRTIQFASVCVFALPGPPLHSSSTPWTTVDQVRCQPPRTAVVNGPRAALATCNRCKNRLLQSHVSHRSLSAHLIFILSEPVNFLSSTIDSASCTRLRNDSQSVFQIAHQMCNRVALAPMLVIRLQHLSVKACRHDKQTNWFMNQLSHYLSSLQGQVLSLFQQLTVCL